MLSFSFSSLFFFFAVHDRLYKCVEDAVCCMHVPWRRKRGCMLFAKCAGQFQSKAHAHTHTHTHTCTRMHACMHACTHGYTHTHTHTSITNPPLKNKQKSLKDGSLLTVIIINLSWYNLQIMCYSNLDWSMLGHGTNSFAQAACAVLYFLWSGCPFCSLK